MQTVTQYLSQTWNVNVWVNDYAYNYTYDSNNNEISEIDQTWSGSAWVNTDQYAYEFDSNGIQFRETDQTWDGTIWDNTYRYTSTYILVPTGIKTNNIVSKFELFNNYPNPFNPSTSIKYSIGGKSLVTLKIYDILGREIETIVNKEQTAGSYQVKFDASNLSSGIYLYQLKAGSFVNTKKMVLLK
jgi:hypothetical protein